MIPTRMWDPWFRSDPNVQRFIELLQDHNEKERDL